MKLLMVLALCLVYVYVDSKLVLPLTRNPSIKSQLERVGKWKQFKARLAKAHPKSKMVSSAPLNDYFNDFFTHTIEIGTPPQTLIVRPDTSSSDLWVMDKNKCTAEQCQGFPSLTSNFNRTLFDSTKSSTYAVMNKVFSSGVCLNGTLSSDYVTLANFNPITQSFGLCYDVDKFMGLHPFDGYLGLAWPQLAADGATPVIQNLIASFNFDQPIFSVYLFNNNNGSITKGNGEAGSITYGGVDATNCASPVNYVPLSSQSYWQFTMGSFNFGNYSFNTNQQVIVSTAEAIIIMPNVHLQAVIARLPNVTHFNIIDGASILVPCSLAPSFPPLNFTMGGVSYLIPGPSYVDVIPVLNDTCALRIESPDGFGFGPSWVLGTPFLRNFCTHHDVGNKQLGFSAANDVVHERF